MVGVANCYGLDGPGFEPPGWGRDFWCPSGPSVGPIVPSVKCVPGLFHENKLAEAWR